MSSVFANNLRRLRLAKKYTQEQVAEKLKVSPQSLSRWECGNTLPDVLMLPEIAQIYGVTIDDLFKEKSAAYDNFARRLLAVYENSREPEDFIRAEMEFIKLFEGGRYTTEDLRLYGILHQCMMNYCMEKAIGSFDKVIEQGSLADEEVYYRTKQQRIYLFSQIGKGEAAIAEQLENIHAGSKNAMEWVLLIAAYYLNGEITSAYEWLKKYDEAFACWDRALEIDSTYCDAKYAKGFCYEELEEYQKAYHIWNELTQDCARGGYDVEIARLKEFANRCKEKF